MIRQDYQVERLDSEFLENPQISESLAYNTTHNHLPQAQLTITCSSSSRKTNEVVVGERRQGEHLAITDSWVKGVKLDGADPCH